MQSLRTVRVSRYVTPLREGGSLPAIVEANDDGLYVSDFLDVAIRLDETRLRALDPAADLDAIKAGPATISVVCAGGPGAGPIGEMSARERFRWIVSPRSTVIQTSPVHTGRTDDPRAALERLFTMMVL
jgi:hypothetical protein